MYDQLVREKGNDEPRPDAPALDSAELFDELWPDPQDQQTTQDAYWVNCQSCGAALNAENGEAHLTANETGFVCDECLYDHLQGGHRNEAAVRY